MTTIKVERAVRDRLAGVARARGVTMGALLEGESHRLAAEQRWVEIEEAYRRCSREDPAGWQEYLDELGEWDAVAEPDPAAAAEWPEHNA